MMLSHLLKLVCFFLATFLTLSLAEAPWKFSEAASWGGDCGSGSNQSPIDIVTANVKEDTSKKVTFTDWGIVHTTIKHTHGKDDHTTWYMSDNPEAKITLDGTIYQLYSVVYHWGSDSSKGSEHSVDGKFYAGESQMLFHNVKYSDFYEALKQDDGIAILSYLLNEKFDLAEDNAIMKYYKANVLKLATQDELILDMTDNIHSLKGVLLDDMSAYRYKGSLAFPPCKENVEWVIVKTPMDVTPSFMAALRGLKKKDGSPLQDNVRPRQALGGRTVYDVSAEKVSR